MYSVAGTGNGFEKGHTETHGNRSYADDVKGGNRSCN